VKLGNAHQPDIACDADGEADETETSGIRTGDGTFLQLQRATEWTETSTGDLEGTLANQSIDQAYTKDIK